MTTKRKTKNKSTKILSGIKQSIFIILHSLKWLLLAALLGGTVVFGVLFGYVSALVKDDHVRPREEIVAALSQSNQTGYIYFKSTNAAGEPELMGQLRAEVDQQPITSIENEVPQIVIDAFLAIEDTDFMEHNGIDIGATLRAVRQEILNENTQTGGSTITQQLARNLFLSLEQTHSRKFKEILLAMRMERYLSKEEILIGYLNRVPFGASSTGYQVNGIKAAARGIFNLELSELNLAQAAYLAGLPQSPAAYSAFTGTGQFKESGFNAAVRRQRLVLLRMLQEGKITEEEYEEALAFDLRSSLAPPSPKAYNTYPFLMLEVEDRATEILMKLRDPDVTPDDPNYQELRASMHNELLHGGYRVYTTIDKEIYEMMQDIAADPENFSPDDEEKGVEQVGAMMIDNKTGAILGMIEGRDYNIEQLNHATQMIRQPGSAMKPIAAYLPALESGDIQPATTLDDTPIILPDGGKGFHIPNNVFLRYDGLMSARHALNHSYNIPAIKLYNDVVGIENAWNFAKKLGITTITESDYSARTGVIGGMANGVTVEELTNAFASIPGQGEFRDAYLIEKITRVDGEVVYEHKVTPERVYSEQTAYLMTDMLKTAIRNGSGTSLLNDFKHWDKTTIAGKTGTTQNYHDVWFVGFNPEVTLGVWIGYDQQAELSREGRGRARSIWAKVMNGAIELKPDYFTTKDFPRPDDIVSMTVSSASGDLPNDLARETGRLITDIFNKKYIPISEDTALVKMEVIEYEGLNYIPHPGTPQDFVKEKVLVRRNPSVVDLIDQIKEMYETYPGGRPKTSSGAVRPISYFIPRDAHLDAPTQVDPRQEDGRTPDMPGNASINRNPDTGEVTISFSASGNTDILGYRLYKSINGMPYQVSQILYAGQDTVFKDKVYNPDKATYFITAVDIAGHESSPTAVLRSHDGAVDPGLMLPPFGGDDEFIEDDEREDSSNHEGSSGNADNSNGQPPSTPSDVSVRVNEDESGVIISWSANPRRENVTEYRIYYSLSKNGPFTRIDTTSKTSYEYLTLPDVGYYRVEAVNAHGTSERSSPVSVND